MILDGTWTLADGQNPTTFDASSNDVTEEQIRFHWWEQQWNVQRWYSAVSRNQYTFLNDLNGDQVPDFAQVTIRPTGACSLADASSCAQIRAAAECALASTTAFDSSMYEHLVFIGPDQWGCGLGVATLGPAPDMFVGLARSLSIGKNASTFVCLFVCLFVCIFIGFAIRSHWPNSRNFAQYWSRTLKRPRRTYGKLRGVW